jgi:hypothetical protein
MTRSEMIHSTALEIWRRFVGIPVTEPYDKELEWLMEKLEDVENFCDANPKQPTKSLTEAVRSVIK